MSDSVEKKSEQEHDKTLVSTCDIFQRKMSQEVSHCSRGNQGQRNVQKCVLRKCKVVVVVFFWLGNVATVAKFLDQTTNQKRHLTKY